jgi:hypothetical protein
MQTRKYPRTLNEAFTNTPEYGCSIEKPVRASAAQRAVNWALLISLVTVILSIAFQGKP